MTVIKFNSTYLKNSVCSNVNDAISYLNNANSIASGMYVPYDFKYKSVLTGLSSKISTNITNLKKFNDWAEKCSSTYSKVEEEHEKRINKIENYSLKKRSTIV